MAAVKVTYTAEQKRQWRDNLLAEQKQLLENALAEFTSSEAWENFVKFGRANLSRLSFNNALLIWSQKREARVVWGRKQWEKQGVTVNPDAQPIRYFAPAGFWTPKDANGDPILDGNGNPVRRPFFRIVTGFDVSDTDAPEPELRELIELDGDDLMHLHAPLENMAALLGYTVKYVEDTGDAHGWVDERMWNIVVNKNLSGNALVRTLLHEVAHIYGNVNYKDYSRAEAEVIVESSVVMTLGILGFDVSEASVPYIASWSDGNLKLIEKYMRLVDAMTKEFVNKLGVE